MFIQLLLIIILIVLGYYGYTLIMKDSQKKEPKDDLPKPASNPSFPGKCEFEGEDVLNKNLYTYDGKLVTQSDTVINCSDCPQYIFKDESGCVYYTFDETYNKDYIGKNSGSTGVCTASIGVAKKCPK